MEIFGWIVLCLLAVFAVAIIALYVIPYIIIEIKALDYKIKTGLKDRRADIDKRSEEKQNRDELKRQKDFELANKKLDVKLQKTDEQIKLYQEKLDLVKKLKTEVKEQQVELNKNKPVESIRRTKKPIEVKQIIEESNDLAIEDIEDEELEESEVQE